MKNLRRACLAIGIIGIPLNVFALIYVRDNPAFNLSGIAYDAFLLWWALSKNSPIADL